MRLPFALREDFMDRQASRSSPFPEDGLGELVYLRTYSRRTADGRQEEWFETVRRVVEGTFTIQKKHSSDWNEAEAQAMAEEMYELIFTMKFLPPGRGLWAMGTPLIHAKGMAAALNNCAFVSTEDLDVESTRPFEFLMDASMLGVGVGFDTKGAGKATVVGPKGTHSPYVIADSRESWVESVRDLLKSYFNGSNPLEFDYSKIRPAGIPLKTFGGTSCGPEPLKELHGELRSILDKLRGSKMNSTAIVDIMNLIGKCVVSGNIRRTAEIAFGEADDVDFLDLKDYEKNAHRMAYGWTSNNSVFAKIGMDYTEISKRIAKNGEPGLAWLDNMKAYSRMCDAPDYKDSKVKGGNPCLEQSLESYEMCCLVETFPARHDNLDEYIRTLKCAFLYAKTVTLEMTHWKETNDCIMRNRRIGCSMSGVAQFLAKHGLDGLKEWTIKGYDAIQSEDDLLSKKFNVPKSVKTTSIKPSGTVSILAGATPGIHFPESRFYIRRVRIASDSPLITSLKNANYPIEPCVGSEKTTSVVEIPIDVGEGVRVAKDVSMWEQLQLTAFLQRHWADNQVSVTITFDPEKEGRDIPYALEHFQYQLKGVSFLPRIDYGAFPQMPYEEIDKAKFEDMKSKLLPIDWRTSLNDGNDAKALKRTRTNESSKSDANSNSNRKLKKRRTLDNDQGMGQELMFCDGGACQMPQKNSTTIPESQNTIITQAESLATNTGYESDKTDDTEIMPNHDVIEDDDEEDRPLSQVPQEISFCDSDVNPKVERLASM